MITEVILMNKLSNQAADWIKLLGLLQHPEGGWFAEVYRSSGAISRAVLPGHDGNRPFMTSIYFMLPHGEVSHLHCLKSDEIWYHHAGGSLTVHQIDEKGQYSLVRLGSNLADGEHLQVVVKAGVWFGATVNSSDAALVGCAVAPGFDFADFELADRAYLSGVFPQHTAIIKLLTHE